MRSLTQLAELASSDALTEKDIEWLHLLLADWQVLADLSAADLVLWLPTDDERFIAVAHSRPATSTTVHIDDIIGLHLPAAREVEFRRAIATGQVVKSPAARWAGTYSMMETCIPVLHDGRVIAVVTREANLSSPRFSLGFDSWTAQVSDNLCQMISRGEYPYDTTPAVTARGVPRVLDGVILIDPDGKVLETTPNATSCLRRLGIRNAVRGKILAQEITNVIADESMIEESMAVVVMGRASWRTEISSHASTITMRALPLTEGRTRLGAVILTRDISEVRRREQELMTKDATIREIHHRVKNNLQTVSALLRLQSRRSERQDVKDALAEAERRVQAIATVHAALSQNVDETVDFDEVARSVLRLAGAVAVTDRSVEVITDGSFGVIAAEQAQALATVLNELVANSVEHGLAERDGTIVVSVQREGETMTVKVADDGVGFEPGTPMSGLGTQIVKQMVRGDLNGSIDWSLRPEGGTVVTLKIHLDEV
ncbi:histidine kinase [Schaalia turicensis]|uniref:histidine kinase n=1 Tax=Schaalia turicensis TaxID=131111 RepID=A0A2I1I5L4_9ACTO|nr:MULTISPECIES: PAS domain-containing sensor histidine kinase [Actinomycetaceae]MDK6399681.1 histidine kinase N-terminal domain-containing protein [Pauljensenia sp. UMB9872]MDK7172072.1 histidine kinase N-terminal domain-containing protein [Pauljensenia sp. UMB1235]PKY66389.1 histidine kinase [Schaalia turicensis]